MRVYRIITAGEILDLYKDEVNEREIVKGGNTHKYEEGKEYIHFFRYSQSAEYYFNKERCDFGLDRYIAYMVANIPNEILNQYKGCGYYNDVDDYYSMFPLVEYAIPKEIFKKEYIVRINNYIEYEYKSNEDEYLKYLNLIKKLFKEGYEYYNIPEYLEKTGIEKILEVQDDDRTEKQIKDDKIKELCKLFKGYD